MQALDFNKLEKLTVSDPIALNVMAYVIDRKKDDPKIHITTLKRVLEQTLGMNITDDELFKSLRRMAETRVLGINKLQNYIQFRQSPKQVARQVLGEAETDRKEEKQKQRVIEVKNKVKTIEENEVVGAHKYDENLNLKLRELAERNDTAKAIFEDLAETRPRAASDLSQRFFIIKKEHPEIIREEFNEIYEELMSLDLAIVIYGRNTTVKDRIFWKVNQSDVGKIALGENIPLAMRENQKEIDEAIREYTFSMGSKIKQPAGRFEKMHENAMKRNEVSVSQPVVIKKPAMPMDGDAHHTIKVEVPNGTDLGELLKWLEHGKTLLNARVSLK